VVLENALGNTRAGGVLFGVLAKGPGGLVLHLPGGGRLVGAKERVDNVFGGVFHVEFQSLLFLLLVDDEIRGTHPARGADVTSLDKKGGRHGGSS